MTVTNYERCPGCGDVINVDLLGQSCEDHGPEEHVDLGGGMVVPISELMDDD